MRKIIGLTFVMILFSAASFAIAPIIGSTSTCVSGSVTLTDATPGGTWSSSNPLVATVGATTGIVNGIAVGAATITYTVGSSFVTVGFTVNPPTVVSGGSIACIGSPVILTGSPSGGSWTSGTPTLATVSSTGVVTGVAPGIVNIYYTAGGCYAFRSMTVNPTPGAITGTTVVGTSGTTALSNATPGGTWSSSNTAIATIGSSSGIATGVMAGTCNITYSVGGCNVHTLLTVTTSVAPIMGSSSVCVGATTMLTNTTPGGTWSSSSPAIATIGSTGMLTGISAGTATITYMVGTTYVTQSIVVNPTPAISGSSSVCIGSTITLTGSPSGGIWSSSTPTMATVSSSGVVTGYSTGIVTITYTLAGCSATKTVSVYATPTITGSSFVCMGSTTTLTGSVPGGTWSSSNMAVATVGSLGVVTGVSTGTANITYTIGSCYAYATVTVNASPTVSGMAFVCAGSMVTLSGTPGGGIWSGSNPAIATIGSSSGNVTGVTAGLVTITYSAGICSAYRIMTVNPVPLITGSSSLCVGSSTVLSATPAGGSWTSGGPSVATVDTTGLVTALTPGVVNIYYTAFGCYSFKPITVNPLPSTITGITTVTVGGTTTLSSATPGGTWSSSNPAVATIGSSSGIVTGVMNGSCNITYSVGGCYVYTYFTVASTTIGPIMGSTTTCVGSSVTLTDSTWGGTWSSSNPAIATIHPMTGLVTGMSAGTVIITYTVGSSYVTRSFTVLSSATVSGSSMVCIGATLALTATPSGGTWSSSAPWMATVNSSGIVSGVSAGVITITYSYSGCYAYKIVTVDPAPVITGSSTVCIGASVSLTASPSGGSWTSGSPTVATVSSSGVVTGVTAGVVNIYYTSGGCYSFKSVTVSSLPAITGPSGTTVGGMATLSNTVPGGTWSSSNPSIANVGSVSGSVTGMTIGSCNITYMAGGCYVYIPFTVSATVIGPITGTTNTCIGSSTTLSSSTPGGTWSSSNPFVASVGTSGMVVGMSAGIATITYTVGSSYVTTTFTVLSAATISGSTSVCTGSTITLTASPAGGIWTSSSPAVATVSSAGIVTGLAAGAVTISYSFSGCHASHTVTVTPSAVITGSSNLCIGASIVLSASPSGGSWTSGSPTVATVSSTGLVTGVTPGVVNIYYTAGGCYTFHPVTVNAAPSISGTSTACIGTPVTLTGTPTGGTWSSGSSWIATVGSSSGIVNPLSTGVVNITYTTGSCPANKSMTINGTPIIIGSGFVCTGSSILLSGSILGGTWSSSNPSVAMVSGGMVSGVSAGFANITYALGSCYSVKPVTVNPSPTITGSGSLCIGTPVTFTGSPTGGTWSNGGSSIATVGVSSGVVTPLSTGVVNITYTLGGCSAFRPATINGTPVILGTGPVCAGSAVTLSGSIPGGTWSSSNPSVATVSGGFVSGISAGTVTITYAVGSCYATMPITVNAPPPPITGPGGVFPGLTITLSNAVPGGTWVSDNPAIASVHPATGVVTGHMLGTVDIHYWIGGCAVSKTIRVSIFPFSPSGEVTPGVKTSFIMGSGVAGGGIAGHGKDGDAHSNEDHSVTASTSGLIQVFPNPTSGLLNIKWINVAAGTTEMIVTDMAGRTVYQSTLQMNTASGETQITLPSLSDGLYLLHFKAGTINYTGRITVQR